MATQILNPTPAPRAVGRPRWGWGLATIVIVAAIAAVLAARWRVGSATVKADNQAAAEAKPGHDPKTTVVLPEGKFQAAGIACGPARADELATEVGVPGQISLNTDRRVEIRPRVTGVVRSVAAMIGQKVKAGDLLVTLESPDVGTARLNLRARQRELATARVEGDWKREVAANVEAMIPLLRKDTPAKQIDDLFRGKSLGSFRGDLLGNYAIYQIAEHEEEKLTDLNKQGLIGEHPVDVSKHAREEKQARLEAALEQVRYDAALQTRVGDQQVRAAEAAVVDAAQRLRILGIDEDMTKVLTPAALAKAAGAGETEDVTAYPIVAPFAGTIVARSAVPSQRAEPTDALFTLADLSTVRVTANVPESQVRLITGVGKSTIKFTVGSYPGRTFEAAVIYVGEEVDPATRTVAMLAEMPNPEGLLRPGMFARILLDTPEKVVAVTVPAGAVVEVEGKPGVFRPGKDDRTFTFAPIAAGRESDGRRVVESGLKAGDQVVVKGAFTLKSELVLQNETEEE
ncbi:MAG TPA: efflux RND transporter periplasmic adaptor subunit [Isosphaeraceae bacterium]|jgi:multidrug efflux pump subunit AcrA (membrane-fusion protein)